MERRIDGPWPGGGDARPALRGRCVVRRGAGSPFAVGTNPLKIAIADMNGDGDLDLVTTNAGSSNASVLLGDGSGGFADAPGSPFFTSGATDSLALGDVNGDGHVDVLSTKGGAGAGTIGLVSVLLGDGAGGLTPSPCSLFPVSFRPTGVAIDDFNEDGKADLAVPDSNEGVVDIQLGQGDGCFAQTAEGFPVGSNPRSVVVADFDADGHVDLAVANQGSRDVSVLLGDGTGEFAPSEGSPVALGRFGWDTAAGDFDEDGHVDLATTGNNVNVVTVFRGTGSGSFAQAQGSPFAVGTQPFAVAAADLNGDSRDDLAVANLGSHDVSVLRSVPDPDTEAPTVDCTTPDATAWYGSDVSVPCSASDDGSGLADPGDASFSLSTSVPSGTETANAITGSREVCDTVGNCAVAGPFRPFKVDRKGPTLSCAGNPTFILRQSGAAVAASVIDGGSGALSSPVSSAADTSSVGPATSLLAGSDVVGNTTATSCPFRVHYAFGGFVAPVKNPPA